MWMCGQCKSNNEDIHQRCLYCNAENPVNQKNKTASNGDLTYAGELLSDNLNLLMKHHKTLAMVSFSFILLWLISGVVKIYFKFDYPVVVSKAISIIGLIAGFLFVLDVVVRIALFYKFFNKE